MPDEEKEPFLLRAAMEMKQELDRKWLIEFGPGYYELDDGSKSNEAYNKLVSAEEKLEARSQRVIGKVMHPPSAYAEFVAVRAA